MFGGVKMTKKASRDIKIVNIVVSSSLGHDIPLEKMAATLSNTEYNPEQFPGLVIRIKEPKTSALIFSSGKIVCTGARTIEKVQESIKKIIKSLEKINIKIKIIAINSLLVNKLLIWHCFDVSACYKGFYGRLFSG